jgi:hypothetical protein
MIYLPLVRDLVEPLPRLVIGRAEHSFMVRERVVRPHVLLPCYRAVRSDQCPPHSPRSILADDDANSKRSVRIPPGFRVSRGTRVSLRSPVSFRLQGCHLLWRKFPFASANRRFCNFARARQRSTNDPTTPRAQRPPA